MTDSSEHDNQSGDRPSFIVCRNGNQPSFIVRRMVGLDRRVVSQTIRLLGERPRRDVFGELYPPLPPNHWHDSLEAACGIAINAVADHVRRHRRRYVSEELDPWLDAWLARVYDFHVPSVTKMAHWVRRVERKRDENIRARAKGVLSLIPFVKENRADVLRAMAPLP